MLATPIEKSDAFKLGIINADGKKIKNPNTSSEKDAYSLLQRFVFKVQRALMKSPDRNAKRLLTVAAAMSILREHDETTLETYTEQDIEALLDMYETDESVERQSKLLEHNLISFNSFLDEEGVVANAAGDGGIDGIGIGPKGEPGRDPVMMPMVRRKKKKKDGDR
jgi:hypothetical protein